MNIVQENKPNNTRQKILEAAISTFIEKGFASASTAEISKRAGVAEVTLFRHFPKKKDLLHYAVLEFINTFGEEFAFDSLKNVLNENKDKSAKELLKLIILDRASFLEKSMPYIKMVFHEIQFHKDVQEIFFEKIIKKAYIIVNTIFEEIKQKENIKSIHSFLAMRSFIGMTFMLIIQRNVFPLSELNSSFEEEVETIIDIFLNGIIVHE